MRLPKDDMRALCISPRFPSESITIWQQQYIHATAAAAITGGALRIAFVCTSWSSTDGGIQTVNRQLAIEMARTGDEIMVMTPEPLPQDVEAAADVGVTLRRASPGFLTAHIALREFSPDVICGHSYFTGAILNALREQFPAALFVHFVHFDPADTEAFKEDRVGRESAREDRTIQEEDAAAAADVVVAIGSWLAQVWRPRFRSVAVEHIDVGLESLEVGERPVSTRPEVLAIGRTESMGVKGLDLFAQAAGVALKQLSQTGKLRPVFVVRGAKTDADKIHRQLVQKARRIYRPTSKASFHVRPFTTQPERLARDRYLARLVVMPSRAEGYGLGAFEAASNGVPFLVSSECGVATVIRDASDVEDAVKASFIWPFGEDRRHVEDLGMRIASVLQDQRLANARVMSLRAHLLPTASWESGARRLRNIFAAHASRKSQLQPTPLSLEKPEQAVKHSRSPLQPVTADSLRSAELIAKVFEEVQGQNGVKLFAGRGEQYLSVYRSLLAGLSGNLDIMGLGLSAFRRDYGRKLGPMAYRSRIRIALLDPAFPVNEPQPTSVASLRENEEERVVGEFRQQVAAYYFKVMVPYREEFDPSRALPGAGLEIRLYKVLPAINIFRVDGYLFFGPYLLAAAAQETPTLLVNRSHEFGRGLFDVFLRHFEEVWSNEGRYRRLENVSVAELQAWSFGKSPSEVSA